MRKLNAGHTLDNFKLSSSQICLSLGPISSLVENNYWCVNMLFPAPLTGLDPQSDDESCVLSGVDSYDAR